MSSVWSVSVVSHTLHVMGDFNADIPFLQNTMSMPLPQSDAPYCTSPMLHGGVHFTLQLKFRRVFDVVTCKVTNIGHFYFHYRMPSSAVKDLF